LILIKWLSRIRSQRLAWTGEAWSDYLYWPSQDRKTLRRINALIVHSLRTPFTGLGKPEALRENLSGFWSRRIDETNRLVYAVDDDQLTVISCRYHY
jgi:toxin YoeB